MAMLNTFGTDITKGGGSVIPTAISSANLQYSPVSDYTSPSPTPAYPVAGLAPALGMTPAADPYAPTDTQKTISSNVDRAMQVNTELAGKASYQSDLAKGAGLTLTQASDGSLQYSDPTIKDLESQLTALTNEAQAIPLQLQQESQGLGRTTGGLAPLQTARLRTNSIAALGVSSLVAAKQGKLETAKMLIDSAVQQKYGALEAEAESIKKNNELLKNDPRTDAAEKKQADAQVIAQQQKLDALAKEKQDYKDTQEALVKIISANPNVDSATLSELKSYTNAADLAAAASQKGLVVNAQNLPASAQEYLFAKQTGYKGTYNDYQNLDANRKASIAAAGVAGNKLLSVTEAQALGVPYGTTQSQAFGQTPTKPLTEVQAKDLTYAARADEANAVLNKMESTISKYNPISFGGQKALEANDFTSGFVADDVRQTRQAERNFGTAALRRESGAAINASEFATLEKQYFPRPGDDAITLAQKAQNRATAIASFKQGAGPSYQNNSPSTPLIIKAPDGTQVQIID